MQSKISFEVKKVLVRITILCSVLIILGSIVWNDSITVYADNGDTIVHVTATGTCYHTATCGHLRSDYPITLYEAVVENGYNPCEDCNPPIYDGPEPLHSKMPKKEGGDTSPSTKSKSSSVKVEKTIEKKETNPIVLWVVRGIVGFIAVALLISFISSVKETFERAKKSAEKRKWEKEQYEKDRQKYYDMYANKEPLDLVEVPEGAFIRDGLPCTSNDKRGIYGDYTVFIAARKATVLHLNSNCGGARLVPVNYASVCKLQHCKRCATKRDVKLPKIAWYEEYQEIKKKKDKYNIP